MTFAEIFGLFILPSAIILLSIVLYIFSREEGE